MPSPPRPAMVTTRNIPCDRCSKPPARASAARRPPGWRPTRLRSGTCSPLKSGNSTERAPWTGMLSWMPCRARTCRSTGPSRRNSTGVRRLSSPSIRVAGRRRMSAGSGWRTARWKKSSSMKKWRGNGPYGSLTATATQNTSPWRCGGGRTRTGAWAAGAFSSVRRPEARLPPPGPGKRTSKRWSSALSRPTGSSTAGSAEARRSG